MIVALGALQADAQEHLAKGLGPALRIAEGAVEIGSRLTITASLSRDQLAGELIERLPLGNAVANPAVKRLHALAIQRLLLAVQHIGPLECPEVGELGSVQQLINEPGAFVGMLIVKKSANFFRSRQDA